MRFRCPLVDFPHIYIERISILLNREKNVTPQNDLFTRREYIYQEHLTDTV